MSGRRGSSAPGHRPVGLPVCLRDAVVWAFRRDAGSGTSMTSPEVIGKSAPLSGCGAPARDRCLVPNACAVVEPRDSSAAGEGVPAGVRATGALAGVARAGCVAG